jgi:NADH-quinone oxidoreductase subunit N
LGVQAGTVAGSQGSLYYLFVYSLLALGSFAVVNAVAGKGDEGHDISSYRGLVRRSPFLATSLAVLLLGQAGAPFTTGFFAKFYVIEAAVSAHSYALAVIAMLSAGVAVFFYLRVVLTMFADDKPGDAIGVESDTSGNTALLNRVAERTKIAVSPWLATGIVLVVLSSIVLGVWPQPLVSFAHNATLLFH